MATVPFGPRYFGKAKVSITERLYESGGLTSPQRPSDWLQWGSGQEWIPGPLEESSLLG